MARLAVTATTIATSAKVAGSSGRTPNSIFSMSRANTADSANPITTPVAMARAAFTINRSEGAAPRIAAPTAVPSTPPRSDRTRLSAGSGVAVGNLVLMLIISQSDEVNLADITGGLLMISAVMLAVGLVACVGSARRALRIQPTDALKEA